MMADWVMVVPIGRDGNLNGPVRATLPLLVLSVRGMMLIRGV